LAAVIGTPRLPVHDTEYSLRHHRVAHSQLKLLLLLVKVQIDAWGSIPQHLRCTAADSLTDDGCTRICNDPPMAAAASPVPAARPANVALLTIAM